MRGIIIFLALLMIISTCFSITEFHYPEGTRVTPPSFISTHLYWETMFISVVKYRPEREFFCSQLITPIGARLMLEKSYLAINTKLYPFLLFSTGERYISTGGDLLLSESFLLSFYCDVNAYIRLCNLNQEPLLWFGGGIEYFSPTLKAMVSFRKGERRLQIGGGVTLLKIGANANLYRFFFNYDPFPNFKSRHIWGLSGSVAFCSFEKWEWDPVMEKYFMFSLGLYYGLL